MTPPKYLNLGCGGERDTSSHWINLDDLHAQLPEGSGARVQLDSEPNYTNFVLLSAPLPFADNSLDGILASHVFEHFHTQDALSLARDCLRVLKPGGPLLVSVPDASYFKGVYPQDCNANWPKLFDVTDPNNPIPTFMQAALFFEQHLQLFTKDSLWCLLKQAGADRVSHYPIPQGPMWMQSGSLGEDFKVLSNRLNRLKFSLVMSATKPV